MSHWNLSPALVSLAGLGYWEPNWSKAWARRRAFPHFSDPSSTRPGRLLLTLPGEVNRKDSVKYERETSQKVLFFSFHSSLCFKNQAGEASKPSEMETPIILQVPPHFDEGEGGRELRFWVGQFLAWPGVFGNHLLLKKRSK